VDVGDEEGDIVHLFTLLVLLLDGLATEDEEVVGTLGEEAHETLGKDLVQLIELLQTDRDTDAVHTCLDENTLLLVTGDDDGSADKLLAEAALNLGLVVTLHNLRGKVGDAHGSSDGCTDGVCVGLDCSRHCDMYKNTKRRVFIGTPRCIIQFQFQK